MTNEEINIAIAEHLGCEPALPNYAGDLNAMHEAEATLTDNEFEDYYNKLENQKPFARPVTRRRHVCGAAAIERAEAFLRTLNKWKD